MRRRMAFVLSIVKGIAMNIGINAIAFALISATGLPGHAQVAQPMPSALAAGAQTSSANAISPHERFEASLKALTENDYYRAAALQHQRHALVARIEKALVLHSRSGAVVERRGLLAVRHAGPVSERKRVLGAGERRFQPLQIAHCAGFDF